MKKVLFTATVDSHILAFHLPYLKYFKDNGYEVHVATNGKEKIPYCDKKFTVPIERSPYKLNNLRAIRKLKKIIDNNKYEIIHTHTPMGSVVTRLAALKTRKINKTRVIYTAHGFHFYKGAPKKNWIIFYPIEKILARYTDTLILVNEEDYLLAKDNLKSDIRYVPSAIGTDELKFNFSLSNSQKSEIRKSLGLKDSDFVMIYPAELSKRKRQVWLINTVKELILNNSDIHLLLPGRDSLKGQCQKLAKEYKIDKQIHFLGFRNDIPKLLTISNLSLSTSFQEGFPVNIMEAMYVGLPIIVSDCRGCRDLIKNNKNGFVVDLDDRLNFTNRIKEVKDNNPKVSLLANQARLDSQRYTLDKVMKQITDIYDLKKINNCLFVHDFRFSVYRNNIYGDGQFEYQNLWKSKYLSLFDNVTIIARGNIAKNNTDIKNKFKLNGPNVNFISTKSIASATIFINFPKVYKKIKEEIKKNDIVIVRLPSMQGLVACFILRKSNKPYIIEVVSNGFDSIYYHDKIKGKILAPILHYLNKYSIRNADNIIYVTNNYLQNVYPNTKNPLACSDVVITEISDKLLEKRIDKIKNYKNKAIKIGLVGSYDLNYKGHELAIKAISEVSKTHNVELHFLGRGNKNRWLKMAKINRIDSVLYFDKPLKPGKAMNEWLDDIDILLVPSKIEGLPRIVVECMSRGGIIVASEVGEIPFILDSKNVFPWNSVQQFSNRIAYLLNNPKEMINIARTNSIKASEYSMVKLSKIRNNYIIQIIDNELSK